MSGTISLDNVSLVYHTRDGETRALDSISLEIGHREFVSIVGPSGCGKSSILSLVAGLVRPTGGRVYIDGDEVHGTSRKTGYMLQQDCLYEWRTILSNAMLGLEVRGERNRATVAKVRAMFREYGLGGFEHHYPRHLSGGMRQRAALIRTLATSPDILLLDEPLSALDYQTRLSVSVDMHAIIKHEDKTVLMVTHDIAEAISMSDRVVVLSARPGRVKAVHDIVLTCSCSTPIGRREAPEFREYFNIIWKELTQNGTGFAQAK